MAAAGGVDAVGPLAEGGGAIFATVADRSAGGTAALADGDAAQGDPGPAGSGGAGEYWRQASRQFMGRAGTDRKVTVIVDRGLTMSGVPEGGERRYVQATLSAESRDRRRRAGAKIILKLVPPMPGSSEGSSVESIDLALPTALADPDALALAARRAIANTPGLVVLVSNQLVPVEDPRLVQVTPDQAMNGVGIDSLQVVGVPRPQAMVRIANESDLSEATLSIHSDGQTIEDEIKLPDRGGAKNYFMDLPSAGKVIEADLSAEGDSLVDQKAWSVQRSVWPKIEADTGIVPELTKMIDVYGRLRPAGADSTTVTVTTAPRELNREAAVAVLAQSAAG